MAHYGHCTHSLHSVNASEISEQQVPVGKNKQIKPKTTKQKL